MSLNKTLDRLFDEIRREAKRNSEFADRLDAVLRLHESRRDVPDGVVADITNPRPQAEEVSPKATEGVQQAPPKPKKPAVVDAPAVQVSAPALNPAGFYKKEGEEALTSALQGQKLSALRALVSEHNLDPGGVTSTLTRDELAAHIVAQARKRAERDDKMFDY